MNSSSLPVHCCSPKTIDVTVVTVCYNALVHLPACIDSVNSQRSSGIIIEHILIDGNSTDGTQAYLQQAREQGRISSFISEPDQGIYDAMNKGITHAQGRMIVFLNADDIFLPNALNALATPILENKADYTIGTARIQQNGKLAHYLWPDPDNAYMGAICCHQTLLCKTEIIRALGGFDGNNFPTIADGELMAKLVAGHYKRYTVEGEHVIFRDGGASANCIIQSADQYTRLIEKYWENINKLIQVRPEHFHRVRWDLDNKIKNLRCSSLNTKDIKMCLQTLHDLQVQLAQYENDQTRTALSLHFKLRLFYLLYRFLTKISFGQMKLKLLQKKYFAKQRIKWFRH